MLHAFSGDAEMARRLAAAGYVVSFALPVAFRSATGPRAAATALAEGSFLVETDSPYLGPDPTARNEPTTVLRVIAELGRLRGVDPEVLVAPIRGSVRARHRSRQRVNACSSHGTPVAIERRGLMPAHKADTEGGPYGPGQRQRAGWRNHGSRWQ